jgi:hypothetical protein
MFLIENDHAGESEEDLLRGLAEDVPDNPNEEGC